MAEKKDIVIIGGGPGGYLAAMRAAQLKKTVTIFEQDRIGGTCINYGCIPTKYLLHQTRILKEIGGTKTLEGPVGEVRLNWAKVQLGRQAVVDQLVKGLVFLLEKGKVEIVKAPARLRADKSVIATTAEGARVIEAGKVVVATGSRAAGLPFLKADGRTVITSTEALELRRSRRACSSSAPGPSAWRWARSTGDWGRTSPCSRSSPRSCPAPTERR
jgi:dihydrolipoamide dehydrogenase